MLAMIFLAGADKNRCEKFMGALNNSCLARKKDDYPTSTESALSLLQHCKDHQGGVQNMNSSEALTEVLPNPRRKWQMSVASNAMRQGTTGGTVPGSIRVTHNETMTMKVVGMLPTAQLTQRVLHHGAWAKCAQMHVIVMRVLTQHSCGMVM